MNEIVVRAVREGPVFAKPSHATRHSPRPTVSGPLNYLIQLLLPLYDNAGSQFPPAHYTAVRDELTDRFGGLTAYTRAPAQGVWQEPAGTPRRDDIVVYEVMTPSLDRTWWAEYRLLLERRFAQQELVVRSQEVERL